MTKQLTLPVLTDAIFQEMLGLGEVVSIRFAVALAQIVQCHGAMTFTLRGRTYACDYDGSIALDWSPGTARAAFSSRSARARVAT